MNPSNRIAFYMRSTTGDLADLSRQKKLIENNFPKRGFDPARLCVSTYVDELATGLPYGPELERLISDLIDGKIDVVMVARVNRISRSMKGLSDFYKLIEARRFRFLSVHENIDSSLWYSMREVAHANC